MSDKLTTKQKIFVSEYLIDFNATRSAKAAGYSEHTAQAIGAENLTKPLIKEELKKGINAVLEQNEYTLKVEIIKELRPIAFGDNEIDIKTDKDGNVLEVSRRDKLRALELLGKYMVMFTDKQQIEHSTIDEKGQKTGFNFVDKPSKN